MTWESKESRQARAESMPERIAQVMWQPLLPEQVATISDPKNPYLRYLTYLAQGLNEEQIARAELQTLGKTIDPKTIANDIGIANRIVGAKSRDQAVLKLVHAQLIPLNQMVIPNEQEIAERIPSLTPRRLQIFRMYAAGYIASEIRHALQIEEQTVRNEYPHIYDGLSQGLGTDNMLRASLVYLRAFGLDSVAEFVPHPKQETSATYEFSHILLPEDLPKIYDRQRPVYEFLSRFRPEQLAQMCGNLTPFERKVLEAYATTGNTSTAAKLQEIDRSGYAFNAALQTAQEVLGADSAEQAAILHLANERGLPSPDKFGLTAKELSILWYYAHDIHSQQVSDMHGVPKTTVDHWFEFAAERFGYSGRGRESQRTVLKLVELGMPIDEFLIPDVDNERLIGIITKLASHERETLSFLSLADRPLLSQFEEDMKSVITSRLYLIKKRLNLPTIQILLLYKKAQQLGLLDQIDPIVRPKRDIKPL